MNLQSERYKAETERDAIEQLMDDGVTDGLPVIPPTPDRIEPLFETVSLEPDDLVGTVPERRRVIRAEKVAINAVMAGCRPEVFPVVIAAVRAVCDPRFSVHGPQASTAGPAVLILINGPIVEELGFRNEAHLFAPGNRNNATVGRALNLTLRNTAGANLDEFDRACFSHAGRYTYCMAENETNSPWTPLHEQRGFDAQDSTVTVFAAEGPNQVANNSGGTGEAVLSTIAGRMSAPGILALGFNSENMVIIGQEHMGTLESDGWDKEEIQDFLADEATITLEEVKESGMLRDDVEDGDEDIDVSLVEDPENLLVVAAGGKAGPFSAVLPGWAGQFNSQAVTLGIPGHASEPACELPNYEEEI